MTELVAFLVKQLPQATALIQKLYGVAPAAIDTIQELSAWVQRTITFLQQEAELTPEQDAALDALIEKHKSEPWWQADAEPGSTESHPTTK